MLDRRLRHVAGADDVVADRLEDVPLGHRQVLVGRGVEDEVGPVGGEDGPELVLEQHRAEDGHERHAREAGLELHLEHEDAVLVAVVEDQALGLVRGELAAELGADRPGRAGDQHRLAGDERVDAGRVELDGLAREQVVHLHLAHLRVDDRPLDELAEGRQDAVTDPGLRAVLDDAAEEHGRGRRDGDQHLADLVLGDERRQVVDPPEHGRAAHAEPDLGDVVVHEADDREPEAAAALDLLEEPDARRSRADDEGPRLDRRRPGAAALLACEPDTDAHADHENGGEQEVEKEDRPWETREAADEDDRGQEERRGEHVAAHDVLEVTHAHVPPPAPGEPEGREARELAAEQHRQQRDDDGHVALGQREVEAQREGEHPGHRRERQVEQRGDRRPVAEQ